MISRNGRPSFCFPSNRTVTVVGAAPDHLADPEAEDEGRVARDSVVIAKVKGIIVKLGWPIAERGQAAPRVEAEHGDRDDAGEVEAAAAASAHASPETSRHDPSAGKHHERVNGREHHDSASERVDRAEAVALLPAWVIHIVCLAAFNSDINDELTGFVGIVAVVLGPH